MAGSVVTARYDLPLAPDDEHNLDAAEVRWLWSFIHGDIMDVQVRNRLREHWGFCSRHAWGYAVIEVELWQAGAGKRGGHQPFDVGILYSDLLGAMQSALTHRGSPIKRLVGRGSCLACDDLRGPELGSIVVTHAGFDSGALAAEANGLAHTAAWLEETRSEWVARICPDCAHGRSGSTARGSLRCRRHLVESGQIDGGTGAQVARHLAVLRSRILALVDSMTQRGEPSTAEIDASWIETLGWFHGWEFPFAVLAMSGEAPAGCSG
jgi:hypothetical protein